MKMVFAALRTVFPDYFNADSDASSTVEKPALVLL